MVEIRMARRDAEVQLNDKTRHTGPNAKEPKN